MSILRNAHIAASNLGVKGPLLKVTVDFLTLLKVILLSSDFIFNRMKVRQYL